MCELIKELRQVGLSINIEQISLWALLRLSLWAVNNHQSPRLKSGQENITNPIRYLVYKKPS